MRAPITGRIAGSEPILRFAGWDHPTRGSEPDSGGQSVGPGSGERMIPTTNFPCQRKTRFCGKIITIGTITTRDCVLPDRRRLTGRHVNLDLVARRKAAFLRQNHLLRPASSQSGGTSTRPQPVGPRITARSAVPHHLWPSKPRGHRIERAETAHRSRTNGAGSRPKTPSVGVRSARHPTLGTNPNSFSINDLRQG